MLSIFSCPYLAIHKFSFIGSNILPVLKLGCLVPTEL